MKIKRKKIMGCEEWICKDCGASHLFHFRYCANCKKVNPIKSKYTTIISKKEYTIVGLEQCASLVAMVVTMRGCSSSSLRKTILKENIERNPFIEPILRLTYNTKISLIFRKSDLSIYPAEHGPSSNIRDILKQVIHRQTGRGLAAGRWNAMLIRLPDEFTEVLNGIIGRNLRLGLNLKSINQVLERLELEPIRRK